MNPIITRWFSPCGSVLLALPAVFLIVPDGIPYVAAACGIYSAQVTQTSVDCTTCTGGGGGVTVEECDVTPTPGKCEFNVEAVVTITIEDCNVVWVRECNGQGCGTNEVAATGIASDKAIDITASCGGAGDALRVRLFLGEGCDGCGPGAWLLDATGECPDP